MKVVILFGIVFTAIFAILGLLALYTFFSILWNKERRPSKIDDVFAPSLVVASASFLFGIIVAPIGKDSSAWVTWWDSLLILGFLPMFIFLKDIGTDILSLGWKKISARKTK